MATGRLVGKTAIVTGGASGIGRAVCRLFAKEGASVAVLDVNAEGIAETHRLLLSHNGNKHCTVQVDVTSGERTAESIKIAKDKLGRKSNILVNAAGILRDNLFVNITESQFDDVINVNLKGTFLMTREFVKSQINSESKEPASIINISSIVGKTGNVGQGNYAASKGGVISMTKTLALEFAKYNIRCNAVLPGFVLTPMTASMPEKVIKMMENLIPMKRQGLPEEIAYACLFLGSDESSYITGACLEVAGGLGA